MKHFQSKVLTAAILAALSGSAIAADVYEKDQVYNKEQVNTEITKAKAEVTTALEGKIADVKTELKNSNDEEIKKVKESITNFKADFKEFLNGKEGDDTKPGLINTLAEVDEKANKAVEAATAAKAKMDEINEQVTAAQEAANGVIELANAVDDNSFAAQDLDGFEVGDEIYAKDADGSIFKRKATQEDVDNDEFGGLGLKQVVGDLDQDVEDLTQTVNETVNNLNKTVDTVNQHTENLKVVETAINENKDAIGKNTANIKAIAEGVRDNVLPALEANRKDIDANTADIATNKADIATNKADIATNKADIATNKADIAANTAAIATNTAAIATKANSADVYTKDQVYTKQESDSKFVKINDRISGLDKTVSDLRKETRQGLAEQAALSGLFQPYNVGRFNVTAAVGGYKSESAVAIGTGFRFTENFAAKAGVAVGTSSGSSAAYHVGVNYEW